MTTKKIPTKPPMELDLDLFLHSTTDDDDDDGEYGGGDNFDLHSVHHRTVDDILNDSDSSSPSPPKSSPFIHHQRRFSEQDDPPRPNNDDVSPSPGPNPPISDSPIPVPPAVDASSKPGSFSRVKPGEFSSGDSFSLGRRAVNRQQLPALFGSVRSNAKPGAALAAAAAASRSIPTPHAAAIKSRRAGIAKLQKILDDKEELSSTSVGESMMVVSDVLNGVGSRITELDEKLSVGDDKFDDFQSAAPDTQSKNGDFAGAVGFAESLREDGGNGAAEDMPILEKHESEATESRVDNSEEAPLELNLDDNSTVSSSNDAKNDNVVSTSADVNAATLSAIDSAKEAVHSSPGFDKERKSEEGLAVRKLEPEEQEVTLANASDDDTNSKNDVDELVEDMIAQIESKRESKITEKKPRPPSKKPLELAEELEKKNAYTGLHWEEGAAAQPMRLEGVRRGSIALGYFDIDSNNAITRTISSQAFKRDHGSPQALAVNLNYIAVGMSKGVIVIVPSKYSAHNVDNMDAKMLMLGLQGDRSHAPVTSMCFNQLGDLLLAGYGDGHITVWDVQRAAAAKVITGEHTAPIVHTFFLGQDSQVTRQFKAVTGDCKGLVLLHAFSVVPLLNRFSIKTQCLLDGQRTGTVLAASPLLLDEVLGGALMSSSGNASVSTGSIGSMMGGVVGGDAGWKLFAEGSTLVEEGVVIFVTHQTALVVRLTPNLEVYAQFTKPDGVREGSMPCTAWKYMAPSRSSSATENMPAEKVSLLAIAWDRKVQVAKLVKSELKVYGKWTLDSAAIGVAWLDDQMLVVLTLTGQLCLFAKDGTVIHQTSFAVDGTRGDDLVAYHTHFTNIYGNPEKAYNNCVAVRGATIYILGPLHLITSRLLPWKERILVLRKAGDWMGALNMAMTLYDGHAHGVIDLPRSLDAVHEAIMPYLVELLQSYVDEVFSYISVAFCNQIGKIEHLDDPKDKSTSVKFEIKEQFTRVGGVAVEFCVHIKRTDILFDEIFSKFVTVQHRDTFLELLEPYILRDMLGSLPPEIMQALVEHYSSKGWLQRVEQCVLHMDISSLDFNQVVRLCREHGLYGALVYLFNRGLDDYRAPLEELLVVLQKSHRESAAVLGYRMLVYLKYCFSGLAFPPGHGDISPERLPSLRVELMQFLLEDSNAQSSKVVKNLSTNRAHPNLYHLLELDTEATLDVLRCAFVEDNILKPVSLDHDLADANMEAEKENDSMAERKKKLVQQTIVALVNILDMDILPTEKSAGDDDVHLGDVWPSKKDIGHLFEFIAFYVACQRACVSKSVLSRILEYLTSENIIPSSAFMHNIEASKGREKQVLSLLEVIPETDWNATYVLELCEKVHFHQVCGLIHTIRRQHLAALDSYMKDVDEPIYAFSFINNTLCQLIDTESAAFRSAIIARIPELFNLSREGTLFLLIDHFNKESSHIISELRSHPKSLFLYLKTVIEVHLSGTLNFSSLIKDDIVDVHCGRRLKDQSYGIEAYLERIADFPKFLRNNPILVTDDMIELYFELLCQYERNSVLKFLETFESYRVEHCLRLCQEYGIIDAAAFLLERVGDVGSALLLTLSGINDKFITLDTAVVNVLANDKIVVIDTVLRMKEVTDISDMLNACIGLCQRNTPRLDPEESESLWFRLLDSFCEPLMDSHNSKMVSEEESHAGTLAESLNVENNEEACKNMWKISKSRGGAQLLRRLFSRFIKEIVEGMIGYVRLPTIMSKLLSDNGSQEFGDFKLTILGMLGTYGFERKILGTAKSLIEDDTFYTMSLLKKGASHGYAPRSLTCCICNCLLTKNSSSSSIRVFSCGHATHLQCESVENEASKRGSGCPVCMPKKKTQKPRSKSFLTENGLVSKSLSKRQQSQGNTVIHPHDSDALESPYGLQQISRFEILTNLQKDQGLIQIENMPQLRLAPPAVYHEKVKKGTDFLTGESSNSIAKVERPSFKNRKIRDLKAKGSSIRFPLKSSIFGKEKTSRQ